MSQRWASMTVCASGLRSQAEGESLGSPPYYDRSQLVIGIFMTSRNFSAADSRESARGHVNKV